MSRPIKFRVWDARKQAYTERCNDKLVFCTSAGSGDLGKYEAIVADLYDPTTQCMEQVPVYYNGYQLILEQFTGLLDSKGVEIYEGDIVDAWSQGQNAKCHVKWGQGIAGFFLYHPRGTVWSLSGGDPEYSQETVTILGNIHQHPELLKT